MPSWHIVRNHLAELEANSVPANDPTDPEMSALLTRIEEYRSQYDFANRSFDRGGVEHLYKTDEDFTAFDIAPPLGGYVGWKRYSVGWYEVMRKYREIHFTFRDDLRVFRRGDVAWMSVSADWFGKTAAGANFAKEMRLTLVWVRHGGDWKVTHEHASSPRTTAVTGGEVI
jgi:ketosteroid isomerase-like protein